MVSKPPFGMASRAFNAKFITTCSIMRASASTGRQVFTALKSQGDLLADQPRKQFQMIGYYFIQIQYLDFHHRLAAEHEQLRCQAGSSFLPPT